MVDYHSGYHSKYLLKVHIILICKYRKKLLRLYASEVKSLCLECSFNNDFIIETMEVDEDHIHLLVDFPPRVSVKEIVRKLKSYTTIMLWKKYLKVLERHFWKEHTFWSDGYFACTIGNANIETIKKYIEAQG
jgi:putative transposase